MFEQERLLMRLQQRVFKDPEILTCFLSGSYGRNTQDPYSDIDLALVFEGEAARERAYDERRDFIRSLMPYVPVKSFDAVHIRPYLHLAVFANGAIVDLRYETRDSLRPTYWDRDIKLIKDTGDWGKQFQNQAQGLSSVRPIDPVTDEELATLDNRFWVMFMDVYRHLKRGEFDKPYPVYLELMNFSMLKLRDHLPVEDPARRAISIAHYDHDTETTLEHLRTLLDTFIKARGAVIRRHNLNYLPDQSFENALIDMVQKK